MATWHSNRQTLLGTQVDEQPSNFSTAIHASRSAATRRVLQLRSWLAHHPTMPVPVVGQLPLIAEEVQEAELEVRSRAGWCVSTCCPSSVLPPGVHAPHDDCAKAGAPAPETCKH